MYFVGKHFLRTIKEWLYNQLYITRKPVIRVYNGYANHQAFFLFGHVLKQSPLTHKQFRQNFLSNTFSLIRLFLVKPFPHTNITIHWHNESIDATTDENGFFKIIWKLQAPLTKGWHSVFAELKINGKTICKEEGKFLVPSATHLALISDIDDTFLISHATHLRKKLKVLLSENAQSRKPFHAVVRHYQLLAKEQDQQRPFFYISSSEWNLYDYLQEFKHNYQIPEGIYLLSSLKQIRQLLKTNPQKHDGKYMRIVRILKAFPKLHFILLGDDGQRDPAIYHSVVKQFPTNIRAVYIRQVKPQPTATMQNMIVSMKELNVPLCYFKNSEEAIQHSAALGFIQLDNGE